MNMEGVSEEGEKPQVEEEVDETKHPEGDQPSEAVVESEHELAILAMPNSSNTDYLLERLDKQLQFGVNIVRNADGSSQPLLSHRKTCTRDDDLPLMVHPVPDSSNFVNVGTSACKRLIGRAFSPQEVTSLIEAIFMSEDEVKMVRDLREDDAQTFIDVIHEVCSVPSFSRHSLFTCLLSLPRSGSGPSGSPTTASEEMHQCLMLDLRSPGFASKIAANPALLQSVR